MSVTLNGRRLYGWRSFGGALAFLLGVVIVGLIFATIGAVFTIPIWLPIVLLKVL